MFMLLFAAADLQLGKTLKQNPSLSQSAGWAIQ
jgi:hypothetical protein